MLRSLASKKGLARVCAFLALVGITSIVNTYSGGARAAALPIVAIQRIIVVDPGHGGIDGGTTGAGLVEKNLTLAISRRVKFYLEGTGFVVKMTRETDVDASQLFPSALSRRHKRDLQNRLDFIRHARAVGSLSIHVNSSSNPRDRGPIVFYDVHSEAGMELARNCQEAANRVAGSNQRPVGRKNLFIIRHAPCPAVLVEVGFLTNQTDSVRLRDPQYLDQMARAVAVAAAQTLRSAPVPPPYVKGTAVNDWVPPV